MDSDNTVQKSTTKIQTQNIIAIVGMGLVGWETISTILHLDSKPSTFINKSATFSKKLFNTIGYYGNKIICSNIIDPFCYSTFNLTMSSINLILSPLSFLDPFFEGIIYY